MSIAVTVAKVLSHKQSVREAPLIRAPCNCIGPAWHSSHRKLRSDCGALLWAADGEAPFKAVLATFLSPTLPYFLPVSQTKMTSSCDVKSKKVQLQLHTWCSTVQWKEQNYPTLNFIPGVNISTQKWKLFPDNFLKTGNFSQIFRACMMDHP